MTYARNRMPLILLTGVIACAGTTDPSGPDAHLARGGANPGGSKVATLELSPPESELVIGGTVQLAATARNALGAVVTADIAWSSGDPAIASVSGSGLVTGVATGGPVLITASSGTGKKRVIATAAVYVNGLGRILFVEADRLWMINADGTGRRQLSADPAMHADLSHDGEWVVHSIPFVNEIIRRRVDGTVVQQLTFHSPPDYGPTWSPDDTQVAWIRESSWGAGNREIFVMQADGSGVIQLTQTSGVEEGAPEWSPDGTRIAFLSSRDGDQELYVMNVDGSGAVTRLTFSPGGDTRPIFSPDGSKILWQSLRDGGDWDLFMMDANGGNIVQLTANAVDDIEARFSPDGRSIIYSSWDAGYCRIYVERLDGSQRRELVAVATPGIVAYPGGWR